jgi:hypothetical protein
MEGLVPGGENRHDLNGIELALGPICQSIVQGSAKYDGLWEHLSHRFCRPRGRRNHRLHELMAALAEKRRHQSESEDSQWSADLSVEGTSPQAAMSAATTLVLSACADTGHQDWVITRVEWTRKHWCGAQSEVWQHLTSGEPFAT